MTRRLLIVEDHSLVGEGLRIGLEAEGHEVRVVDGSDVQLAALAAYEPEAVILDLNLGAVGSGIDLLDRFESPVVVLTGETDPSVLGAAYDAGASVVLDKAIPFPRLLRYIDEVLDGDTVELESRRHEVMAARRAASRERDEALRPFAELTAREQSVLGMLMEGMQAAEVAEASFVSISTVRSQIRSILSKLGVSSQLTAVAMATRAGWRPPD